MLALDGHLPNKRGMPGIATAIKVPIALTQSMDEVALCYCYHRHVIHPGPRSVTDERILVSMKVSPTLQES